MYRKSTIVKSKQGDIGAQNMFYGAQPILFEFAKYNRIHPTEAEEYLWKYLSKGMFEGLRFRRQHPIKYFIADFYCHKARLIIEVDGGYHNEPEQYQYDRSRDEELIDLGLTILHFTNEQILYDIGTVIGLINARLQQPLNPSFRGQGVRTLP
ncbi:MAG: endonuclease domain-containing protein [Dysgonamonadaceae bacterium]|jgi:cyclase|nr:endonuclease domain-containing protein [Dysgonamonadaceae bacterium]